MADLPEVKRNHIMGMDWFWYYFLEQASTGLIEKIVEQISDQVKVEVRVLVEVNEFNKVPEPDIERSVPSDTVEFAILPMNQRWNIVQESRNVLSKLKRVNNISDLSQQISAITDLRFYWIDLVIGIRLKYGDKQGWHSSDIWDNALSPWVALFK